MVMDEVSSAYTTLYEEVINRDTNKVSLYLLNPSSDKPKDVLIAWILGAWDGVGDRGDVDVNNFMEKLRIRMEPKYREWWDEWLVETQS